MTDKPIIFSAPMVRALLDGRKTQTRRLLKGLWQSELEGHDVVKTWFAPPDVPKEGIPNQWAQSGIWAEKHGEDGYNRHLGFTAYRPGDRLYVREAWRTEARFDDRKPLAVPPGEWIWFEAQDDVPFEPSAAGRLRPGMFMPRWASRITLTVTEVRVQRLQEISEEDAVAEGIEQARSGRFYDPTVSRGTAAHLGGMFYGAKPAYEVLWNSLHGPDAWDANPWVVALTFTVQHGNIDLVKS